MQNVKMGTKGLIVAGALALSTQGLSAADDITLALNWLPSDAHAGYVYGRELGFYADRGIELEIEPGRGSGPTSQLVASGQADFGHANAATAMNLASRGAPVVVIAPISQAGQFGLIFRSDNPLESPADLEGKRVAVCAGCPSLTLLQAFIEANDVDVDNVEIITAEGNAFVGLIAEGRVDAAVDVPGAVMLPLISQGINADILYMRDFGVSLISTSLIGNSERMEQDPDLFARFVEASLLGLEAAVQNPEAAMEALRAAFPDTKSQEELLQAFEFTVGTYCVAGAESYGNPGDAAWSAAYDIMVNRLNFPADMPVSHYYTSQFVPEDAPGCS